MSDHVIAAFVGACFISLACGIGIGLYRAMGEASFLITVPVGVLIGYAAAWTIDHRIYGE